MKLIKYLKNHLFTNFQQIFNYLKFILMMIDCISLQFTSFKNILGYQPGFRWGRFTKIQDEIHFSNERFMFFHLWHKDLKEIFLKFLECKIYFIYWCNLTHCNDILNSFKSIYFYYFLVFLHQLHSIYKFLEKLK